MMIFYFSFFYFFILTHKIGQDDVKPKVNFLYGQNFYLFYFFIFFTWSKNFLKWCKTQSLQGICMSPPSFRREQSVLSLVRHKAKKPVQKNKMLRPPPIKQMQLKFLYMDKMSSWLVKKVTNRILQHLFVLVSLNSVS